MSGTLASQRRDGRREVEVCGDRLLSKSAAGEPKRRAQEESLKRGGKAHGGIKGERAKREHWWLDSLLGQIL